MISKNIENTKIEFLSIDEEKELSKLIINNPKDSILFIQARNKLVSSFIPLAINICKNKYHGDNFNDFLQEANMGLIKAANNFDYRLGRFSTIATKYITYAINDAYNKQKYINIPHKIRKELKRLEIIKNDFLANNYEEPSISYLAKKLSCSENYIRFLQIIPIMVNDKSNYINKIKQKEDTLDFNMIEDKLSILEPLETKIVCMYLGIGYEKNYTFKEISNIIGYSSERIRQLYNSSILKMREE